MKLEVGKYYKTRNGRKYKCVHDFGERAYMRGRFLCGCDDGNGGHDYKFDRVGKNTNQFCGVELISESVEPVAHTVDVYLIKNSVSEPMYAISRTPNPYEIPIAKKTITFTAGEGL